MSIMQSATADFRAKMTGQLQFVDVPEWPNDQGKPERIYYKPSMTLKQQEKILALHAQDKIGQAVAQTLITRSLDVDGNKLFKQADMTELMHEVDPEVTSRIVAAMSEKESDVYTQKAIEKNY